LVGKPEGNRSLGRRRWEDNIKTDLKEIWCEGVEWFYVAQNSVVWLSSCEHGDEISGFVKSGKFLQ
jgi:hypothetical protein